MGEGGRAASRLPFGLGPSDVLPEPLPPLGRIDWAASARALAPARARARAPRRAARDAGDLALPEEGDAAAPPHKPVFVPRGPRPRRRAWEKPEYPNHTNVAPELLEALRRQLEPEGNKSPPSWVPPAAHLEEDESRETPATSSPQSSLVFQQQAQTGSGSEAGTPSLSRRRGTGVIRSPSIVHDGPEEPAWCPSSQCPKARADAEKVLEAVVRSIDDAFELTHDMAATFKDFMMDCTDVSFSNN